MVKSGAGTAAKILLIVLGIFLLIGAMALAGIAYAGYRVKNRIEQVSRDNGVDIGKLTAPAKAARRTDPCMLITPAEASAILGLEIERTAKQESPGQSVCHYWAKAAAPDENSAKIAQSLDALNQKQASRQHDMEALENLTKTVLGGAAGQGYFSITVDWDGGRAAVAAMKLMGAADRRLPLSDGAAFGPLNCMLVFSKGATGVQIDLRLVPDGREKGIQIARIVEARL